MLNRLKIFSLIILSLALLSACSKTKTGHSGRYSYEMVPGDPLKAQIYSLENGLKVYLSVYQNAPRIQSIIAVRVGSKNDPADYTGLAHYLEHLLFKGTDQYGSADYTKEKPLLDEIVQLYENYSHETDTLMRAQIYQKIDSVSYQASKYAIASEYDKMLAMIGAEGTNAFTGNDMTAYVNDIPNNHIRQWLKIEAERFRNPVFRLFHTELEVVYEEKNISMDSDWRKQWEALLAGLWPTHPYGTQTTLGKPEHLKNPSIKNVYDYYHSYYVPNNMAICLSGDFNPDSMIAMIDETFGTLPSKEIPEWRPPVEAPISEPIQREVYGPDMESVNIGFRFPGALTKESELLLVTDWLMMNGVAGIIDLNLNQKQVVINPSSGTNILTDYAAHIFSARPREGQSLDEVRDHLLAQIDSLKAGAFPDWLPAAAVNNLKLNEIKSLERNWSRANTMAMAFINHQKWEDVVNKWDFRNNISKKDIIDFANRYYGDNYVVVYKRTGEDPNAMKIKKPPITPVELNREARSDFVKSVGDMESSEIMPVYLDYSRDIDRLQMKNEIPVLYKNNNENDLFSMHYIANLGNNHNNKFGVALEYLTYLGTSKYTPEEFKEEMYKLGCSFGAWSSDDRLRVYFSGLNESFEKGFELFEHLLADAQPNQQALDNLIIDILKKRQDNKLNKWTILNRAMRNYGVYGIKSPFRNILTEQELKDLTPGELIDIIKKVTKFEHRILYYGPLSGDNLLSKLNSHHQVPEIFQSAPDPKQFTQLATDRDQVYICNYDMKQVEIILLSKSVPYNRDNLAVRTLFNEYYGRNMSSIVFQTLRESQALAYAVWGSYTTPGKKQDAHYIQAYIGTQADKMDDALKGMKNLLDEMARAENYFNDSKDAILNRIRTERITREDILWRYEQDVRMGNQEYDFRKDVFSQIPDISMDNVAKFFDEYIKDKEYSILVLGDVDKLDFNVLKRFGRVKELTLEEVFGY